MSLPSSIPTSFVPHPNAERRQFRTDFTGAFGFFAYAVLFIVVVLSASVFFYNRILEAEKISKDKDLDIAGKSIDQKTVENFIRLRNRLDSGKALLTNHISTTEVFTTLEKVLPSSVRLTSLRISFDSKNVPKFEGSGTATSFNSLAFASSAFASSTLSSGNRIKDVIFSNIKIEKDTSVSFSIMATLDPKILNFSP